jgi:hypothetical protein
MHVENILDTSVDVGATILSQPSDNARSVTAFEHVCLVISVTGNPMHIFVPIDDTDSDRHRKNLSPTFSVALMKVSKYPSKSFSLLAFAPIGNRADLLALSE